MIYILNIETATKNCSVSLALNGETILCKEISDQGYSHAEKLHVFIQQILSDCKIDISQLNAVAVGQGPGSYTGLRIGTSAAKGLCYALDIPLIAINSLQILAQQVGVDNGFIIPMLDARRMEVYSSILDKNHNQIRAVEAQIIDENSFEKFTENIYFVGDCAAKCKPILAKENFIFIDKIIYPSANEMGKLSYQKFINNGFESLAYFEPLYLKDGVFKN